MFPIFFLLSFSTCVFSHSGRCFEENQACKVHENNLLSSVPGVRTLEECRSICRNTNDCNYISYFGPNSYPIKNFCMAFAECASLHSCLDCVTEEKFCEKVCSEHVEGSIDENTIDVIADVENEMSCMESCKTNPLCKFYTYHSSADPNYPRLCFHLSEILGPVQQCDYCSTGAADCSSSSFCSFSLPDDNMLRTSALFDEPSSSISIRSVHVGNRTCEVTMLGVGGGGTTNGNGGGGGSGEVSFISYLQQKSTELFITVGGAGQLSSIRTIDGEILMEAQAGGDSIRDDGGNGYSGGGGYGTSGGGKGGENGDDGQSGSGNNQGKGGLGSGIEISKFQLESFTLNPVPGGAPDGTCGSGGEGIFINGNGPSKTGVQSQGYGGGGHCFQDNEQSGAVIIEIK